MKYMKLNKLFNSRFFLFVNTWILTVKPIARISLSTIHYKKVLQLSIQYKRQSFQLSTEEIIEGILIGYYNLKRSKRPFLKDMIQITNRVKNTVPITNNNNQRRNSKCNCGSGKKYKHCCMISQKEK